MARLKCQECGRAFKYHHQLRKHRRGHSMMNRTTYRCKICNKVFSFLFKLREHLGRHFNCKTGENMYIDDLAIGVTIEPVKETGYDWAASRCASLPNVGGARESSEGEPCHCVPAEDCMTVCNPRHMYSCSGCPRHAAVRPPYRICPCHHHTSCCSTFPPQPGLTFPRYSSTRLVNPQLVLHLDTMQDSTLALPPGQHCVLQDNPCHCHLPGEPGQRSCLKQELSGSVLGHKLSCSNYRCCVATETMGNEDRYRDHATTAAAAADDDDDDDLEEGQSDSDNTSLHPQSKISVLEDPGQKADSGTNVRNMSNFTVSAPPVTKNVLEMSACGKTSQTEREESTNKSHGEEQTSDKDWEACSGCSRPDAEHSDASTINLKIPSHSAHDHSMEGMEDFDDMATLNDLSNFFPDLNDNPSDQPPGQVNSESMLDTSLSNNLIIGLEHASSTELHEKSECVCETDKPGMSDIEACVKNGLDSTAINPTVVVSDLQDCLGSDLQCHRRGRRRKRNKDFHCDLCDVTYDTRIALANHKRSKKHVQTESNSHEADVPENQKRRRSDRNLNKCSTDVEEDKSESGEGRQDTGTSDRMLRVSPKRSCSKVSDRRDHPETVLSDELRSKMGRSGFKSGSYRRRSCGPQLKATVTKLNIQCYICGKAFTTKQHFIIHAKEHLRKLGYCEKKDDLFYCTICFAFYPCENDLREHLINKHVDDDLAALETSQTQHPGWYPQHGSNLEASSSADADRDGNTAMPRTYCSRKGYGESWNDGGMMTKVRPRLISGSDSDIAESTTDQLVFEEMDSPESRVNPEAETEESQDYCMCHVCGDTYASMSDLVQHLKTHDDAGPPVEAGDGCQEMGWKPRRSSSAFSTNRAAPRSGLQSSRHSCSVCRRVLPSHHALKSHMQVHDPDRKRLRCPLCQGECVWKQNFKNHLLRHGTPVGQSFSTVHFAPHSKILCPFCSEVNLYQSVDEYKIHMLVHVNKIMNEECGKTTFHGHNHLNRKIPVDMKPREGKIPGQRATQPAGNLFIRTYKKKSPVKQNTKVTLGRRGPAMTSQPPTSTPNTHGYPPDNTADPNCTDGSPEGSLQGNSGLFMSPEWSWSTGSQSGPPNRGAYTQLAPPESQAVSLVKKVGANHRSLPVEPDLNDSGFIQTFSGESDFGDMSTSTPLQRLPSFNTFTSKLHTQAPPNKSRTQAPPHKSRTQALPAQSPMRALPPQRPMQNMAPTQQYPRYSGSSTASRPAHTGPAFTREATQGVQRSHLREFLSLARVSELMKTTSSYTEAFEREGHRCSICQSVVLTQHNVKEHLFTHFDGNGRFAFIKRDRKHECPICFKMVGERRSATAHLFSHWGASILRCPACNKPFNFLKTLKVHAQKQHPDFKFSTSLFDNI
ncbi:zinc finger protein 646-like [Haliotis cracherodii]|uniref:zinc finger protein 646-like n=1 Tax=Haliotis cracherodii TaxID=6455 RepID=UPI0039E8C8B9